MKILKNLLLTLFSKEINKIVSYNKEKRKPETQMSKEKLKII